jgi:RNA polymerase sigma-70 factor, ECF subfamily
MSVTQSTTTDQQAPDALRAAYDAALGAWPRIALSFEQFRSSVSKLGGMGTPAYPADLYLCVACASGSIAAVQALEAAYFPALRGPIYRVVGDLAGVEDVLQEVRTRLLVGVAPRIVTYRGDGSLAGWLRRVAVRSAQDHRRARLVENCRRRKLAGFQLSSDGVAAVSPELLGASQHFEQLCERTWTQVIGSLDSTERRLLYYHYACGLSIDTLAPLYQKHRATVARRIRRATERLRRMVRKALSEQGGGLSASDLDALVLQGQWDPDLSEALFRPGIDAHAA